MERVSDIVALVSRLAAAEDRSAVGDELARHIGAARLVCFVDDPDLGILLPARGWPRTLPGALHWREFLSRTAGAGRHEGPLSYPDALSSAPCVGLAEGGAAVVLVGGRPDPWAFATLTGLLPLLSAVFRAEHVAVNAQATASLARNAVARLREQTASLEQARRMASDELLERRRVELDLQRKAIELQRSNEDLQHFAAIVSHDLQEPLRMVSNYLSLIRHRSAEHIDGKTRGYLDYAVAGADRMSTLIKALLGYAQVGAGQRDFVMVPLEAVAPEALQNLSRRIDETHACIAVGDLPSLIGDHVLLVQLFQNLIGNALKFCRPGTVPTVEVSATWMAPMWEVTIADNGIGIAEAHLERIFGVFQRLHAVEEFEGTGIGLATCKRIVLLHGGRIRVESQLGTGSRFIVSLPGNRSSLG